ncbi:MAG: 1-acyl-sn-glycerol-3-phosphate acyltransferase [Firmicutes bacterium]|nr:1-acyl-sn-glycerol-3-phosphate acyltransferase [Bacillota bacterium]
MLYWVLRRILCFVAWSLFRVRVWGKENVPSTGPLIVCSNHLNWWDPVVVAGAVPRKVSFMAKEELFRYPVFGQVLRMVEAFPVRRGAADRQAIASAGKVLAAGGAVGVFPEGTRSRTGELGKANNGGAYLAMRNAAPVLPVGITGPYGVGRTVKVIIGEPFMLDGFAGRPTSQDVEHGGARVMKAIAGLIDRGKSIEGQVR